MAAGLPVLVSDVGGAADIVDAEQTGWLIEPRPGALAISLDRALRERPRLGAMGAAARSRAERVFDASRNDREVVAACADLAFAHEGVTSRRGLLNPVP